MNEDLIVMILHLSKEKMLGQARWQIACMSYNAFGSQNAIIYHNKEESKKINNKHSQGSASTPAADWLFCLGSATGTTAIIMATITIVMANIFEHILELGEQVATGFILWVDTICVSLDSQDMR